MSSTVEIGKYGEDQIKGLLISKGFTILCQNFRCKYGEVDLITRYKQRIYLIEVKIRRSSNFGGSIEAVSPLKLSRIVRTGLICLYKQDMDPEKLAGVIVAGIDWSWQRRKYVVNWVKIEV